MSLFLAWIIIIVVLLLVLILLRKFIKRLIFILVLLVVTFFMYGLFSPSGAGKVWESVKVFPYWIASFLGGEKVSDGSNVDMLSVEPPSVELPTVEVENFVIEQSAVLLPSVVSTESSTFIEDEALPSSPVEEVL
jgi:hypothetical protein